MDAYARESGTDLHQGETGGGHVLAETGERASSSSAKERHHDELKQKLPISDSRQRHAILSKPDRGLAKRRRRNESAVTTPYTAQSRTKSRGINDNKAPSTPRQSSIEEIQSVAVNSPPLPQANRAAQDSEHRFRERFKNLRHRNNYFKLAQREPAPYVSKVELRAPDEWPVSGGTHSASQARVNASAKDKGNESWLFVPDEVNQKETAKSGPLTPPQNGLRDVRNDDSSASSRTTPPLSDNSVRGPDFSAPKQIITARNGRSWHPGAIVVRLLFGEHMVGDVKILHLPPWLQKKLLALKRPFEQTLDIHFLERNVVSVDRFSALSRNV